MSYVSSRPFSAAAEATRIDGVLEAVRQVDGALVELHLASLDLREVEDVAQQREQDLAARPDGGDALPLVLRQVGVVDHARHADDGVEGRAQLVAHVGQEGGLRAPGFEGGVARHRELLGVVTSQRLGTPRSRDPLVGRATRGDREHQQREVDGHVVAEDQLPGALLELRTDQPELLDHDDRDRARERHARPDDAGAQADDVGRDRRNQRQEKRAGGRPAVEQRIDDENARAGGQREVGDYPQLAFGQRPPRQPPGGEHHDGPGNLHRRRPGASHGHAARRDDEPHPAGDEHEDPQLRLTGAYRGRGGGHVAFLPPSTSRADGTSCRYRSPVSERKVSSRRELLGDAARTMPLEVRTLSVPRLELVVESEAGAASTRVVTLDGDRSRIGSHPSNDLVLADPRVSRFHCTIHREGTGWRISDAGSLNGTRLAGVRVWEAELPPTECRMELGESVVQVRQVPSASRLDFVPQARFGALYGVSLPMQKLFALLERVSKSDVNVLIEGESGTGKELVASEIVRHGARARRPFVVVDCSAISPHLIESELFGHVRGAFTGADRDRPGAFEAADGGTVFLDEIGEMPLDMQPKLLRALEAREIRRVGETRPRKVDVRVIAATNKFLEREVNQGRVREDLYFRLSVVTIPLPPLRERPEDIKELVRIFLDTLGAGSSAALFTPTVLDDLSRHRWPGNVRELRNYVERAVVLEATPPATSPLTPPEPASAAPAPPAVDLDVPFNAAKQRLVAEFEVQYLTRLLEWADGNVTRAAKHARMDRMNLHRLVQLHGLRAPRSIEE